MLALRDTSILMQSHTASTNEPYTDAPVSEGDTGRNPSTWLFPKPFTVVSTLLYLGILALYFHDRLVLALSSVQTNGSTTAVQPNSASHPPTLPAASWQWNEVIAAGAVIALLAIDRIEYRLFGDKPTVRIAVGMLLLRVALIEVVAQLDQFSFSPVLYLIVPFYASLYFGMRASYWIAATVGVAYIAKLTWYQRDWYTNEIILRDFLVFGVGLLFVMAMAQVVRNEKASRARAERLLSELERSHRQLQAYSEQVAELAATRERNRMARDIHDSLGHYLTVVNVQLEKALAYRDKKPEEADRAVEDAKRLAAEALQNVRYSVATLRDGAEQFSLQAGLAQLVENVHGRRLKVRLLWTGSESGYTPDALIALYHSAQEALTNVQKHSGARHAEVEAALGSESATLSITDDGHGFDPADQEAQHAHHDGGYGLLGIRERLELVGGTLQLTSAPGRGTRLLIQAPRDGAAPGHESRPALPDPQEVAT
jgi:signal transduction histidine kinase